jgi:hypothetical protein
VAGSCEHDIEALGFTKYGEFLDSPRNCLPSNKYCVLRNYLLLQYILTFHIVCPTSYSVTNVLHIAVKVMLPSFKKGLYSLLCNLLLIIHRISYVGDFRFHLTNHQAIWLKTVYYRDYFFHVYGHRISYRSII